MFTVRAAELTKQWRKKGVEAYLSVAQQTRCGYLCNVAQHWKTAVNKDNNSPHFMSWWQIFTWQESKIRDCHSGGNIDGHIWYSRTQEVWAGNASWRVLGLTWQLNLKTMTDTVIWSTQITERKETWTKGFGKGIQLKSRTSIVCHKRWA